VPEAIGGFREYHNCKEEIERRHADEQYLRDIHRQKEAAVSIQGIHACRCDTQSSSYINASLAINKGSGADLSLIVIGKMNMLGREKSDPCKSLRLDHASTLLKLWGAAIDQ
jgi:hypothetical protein